MRRYKFNPCILSKKNIIKNLTIEKYGYLLTDDMYKALTISRSNYLDKLLCEYSKNFFVNNNINNANNLHRWNLNNRNKTKNESNYPW